MNGPNWLRNPKMFYRNIEPHFRSKKTLNSCLFFNNFSKPQRLVVGFGVGLVFTLLGVGLNNLMKYFRSNGNGNNYEQMG